MKTEMNFAGRTHSTGATGLDGRDAASTYDPTTIRLHWITAGLVVALWCLGQTIDWFGQGMPRIAARSTHITLGVVLGLILCYRLWWRAGAGRRLPAAGSGMTQQLSTFVHYLLYVALVVVVVLGLANTWVRGDNIFNLFSIPAFDPGNKALRQQIGELHDLAANALLIVAGLHASAALIHHFFLRDGVLRRMLSR
jgi:cytochrome b561